MAADMSDDSIQKLENTRLSDSDKLEAANEQGTSQSETANSDEDRIREESEILSELVEKLNKTETNKVEKQKSFKISG